MRAGDYTPPPLNITHWCNTSFHTDLVFESKFCGWNHSWSCSQLGIQRHPAHWWCDHNHYEKLKHMVYYLYPTGLLCIVIITALSIPHCGCYSHPVLHHWCICISCHWCDSHLHTTANNADQGVSQTKVSWSFRILLADQCGDLCSFFYQNVMTSAHFICF